MDERTYQSVLAVLEYLWKEEQRHWEESGEPDNHIFLHLKQLASWADEVANWIGTIPYEVLCGIGSRVPRLYESA